MIEQNNNNILKTSDSAMHFKRKIRGLITTYKCNLDCLYCYIENKSNKAMTLQVMKNAIISGFSDTNDYIFDELEIDFMGAEPLCEFELIKEIAEWVWSQEWPKPYILYATTNGTLLNSSIKDWFTTHRDKFVLGLSYDGNDEMQDTNRSVSSKHIDKQFFLNNWPTQPVKMTITEDNVSCLAEGIIALHENGFLINANPANGMPEWKADSIAKYGHQLSILVDYYCRNPHVKKSSLLDIDLFALLRQPAPNEHKYCGAGIGFEVVDVDGSIYPCHMFSPLVIKEPKLSKVKDINFNCRELFESSKCKKCPLMRICPTCYGMNFRDTGDPAQRQPTLCKLFLLQYLANCSYWLASVKQKKQLSRADLKLLLMIQKIKGFLPRSNMN